MKLRNRRRHSLTKKYSKKDKKRTTRQKRTTRRRRTNRNKRGGVPNNNVDDTLVRLPYTRQNIINGYAMSIARNPDNYYFYLDRLNIFLNNENYNQVLPEELNIAVQNAQQRLEQ